MASDIKAGVESGDEMRRGIDLNAARQPQNLGEDHEKPVIQLHQTPIEPS
jgi:hypothetical protein